MSDVRRLLTAWPTYDGRVRARFYGHVWRLDRAQALALVDAVETIDANAATP